MAFASSSPPATVPRPLVGLSMRSKHLPPAPRPLVGLSKRSRHPPDQRGSRGPGPGPGAKSTIRMQVGKNTKKRPLPCA